MKILQAINIIFKNITYTICTYFITFVYITYANKSLIWYFELQGNQDLKKQAC